MQISRIGTTGRSKNKPVYQVNYNGVYYVVCPKDLSVTTTREGVAKFDGKLYRKTVSIRGFLAADLIEAVGKFEKTEVQP